jgi:hypothetical protein
VASCYLGSSASYSASACATSCVVILIYANLNLSLYYLLIPFNLKTVTLSATAGSTPTSVTFSCASAYNTGSEVLCSGGSCSTTVYCNTDNCNLPPANSISISYKSNSSIKLSINYFLVLSSVGFVILNKFI